MIRTAMLILALAAGPAGAEALTKLDPARSRIGFAYTQMGVSLEGRFAAFAGQVAFDPDKPQTAKAVIEVKLASIDTGLAEADAEVAGKDWFDSARYPLARFESTALKPLGDNRYQVEGRLAIKGRTRTVAAPFTFTPDASGGQFAGAFTLRRADFAIGEGAWRDFSVVGNDIAVRFKLRINR